MASAGNKSNGDSMAANLRELGLFIARRKKKRRKKGIQSLKWERSPLSCYLDVFTN